MKIDKEDKTFIAKLRWDFATTKVVVFEKTEKMAIKALKKSHPAYELLKIENIQYVKRK